MTRGHSLVYSLGSKGPEIPRASRVEERSGL
jgi:hypothetical protein